MARKNNESKPVETIAPETAAPETAAQVDRGDAGTGTTGTTGTRKRKPVDPLTVEGYRVRAEIVKQYTVEHSPIGTDEYAPVEGGVYSDRKKALAHAGVLRQQAELDKARARLFSSTDQQAIPDQPGE